MYFFVVPSFAVVFAVFLSSSQSFAVVFAIVFVIFPSFAVIFAVLIVVFVVVHRRLRRRLSCPSVIVAKKRKTKNNRSAY